MCVVAALEMCFRKFWGVKKYLFLKLVYCLSFFSAMPAV
jgi:hypothetical protein